MLAIQLLIVALLVILCSSQHLYGEKYRPQLHYSPPSGWMNDPNGLVYHDGLYHLFYQHTPNHTVPGEIHWGHAVSSDLLHWRTLPIALYPEEGHSIFSGSAIIDQNNVTGLQTSDAAGKTLIAIFTAHDIDSGEENQWLAYSNDAPLYEQFTFYEENPIIGNPDPIGQKDFRDPQVFQYEEQFVLLVAAFNRILFYKSSDLIDWSLVSEFGEHDGSHEDVWECPSLFPLNVTVDGEEVQKWVLIVSLGPDQQYFIGSFDGQTFINDNDNNTELWVDYGPDSYAGVTYNLLPDGRRIFISWMNRWEYAINLEFNDWNGQMGIARELYLVVGAENMVRLASLPVREIESLRVEQVHSIKNQLIESRADFEIENTSEMSNLLDIEMTVDLTQFQESDKLRIELAGKEQTIYILFEEEYFTLSRTDDGRELFNGASIWMAPRLTDDQQLKLRIIIDRSSIEMYADDGLSVLAALYYSEDDLTSNVAIAYDTTERESSLNLMELNVYRLESIWM